MNQLMAVSAGRVGIAKELYDYKSYGKYDYRDMIATIIGGIALLITQLLR